MHQTTTDACCHFRGHTCHDESDKMNRRSVSRANDDEKVRTAWENNTPHALPPPPGYKFIEQNSFKIFEPLLVSLRFIGAYPTFAQVNKGKSKIPSFTDKILVFWEILLIILLHADAVHYGVRSYIRFRKYDFWLTISSFMRTAASAVTCDLLVLRSHKLNFLIDWTHLVPSDEKNIKSLTRHAKVVFVTFWAFIGLRCALECMLLLTPFQVKRYIYSHWYESKAIYFISPGFTYVLAWVYASFDQLLMNAHLIFPVGLYLCLAKSITHKFILFNVMLKHESSQSWQLSASAIQRHRTLFCELSSMVELMDEVFSASVLLWYAIFLLAACVQSTRFYTNLNDPEKDSVVLAGVAVDLTFMILWFIIMSFFAAQLTEEAHECLPLIHRMSVAHEVWDKAFFCQASLLTSQLSSPQVALSGWNFFDIDRGVILTLGGALLTYVVLIIQMTPSPTTPTPTPTMEY